MSTYDETKHRRGGNPANVGQYSPKDHAEAEGVSLIEPSTQITSNAAAYLSGDDLADGWGLPEVAGDHADDYNLDAATEEFEGEVTEILHRYRPNWEIDGSFIVGPASDDSLTEEERASIVEEIGDIDAGAILARHARTKATACFRDGSTQIAIEVPDAEDVDFAVIDGETAATIVDYAPSAEGGADWVDEEWEPDRYREALRAAGWVVTTPNFESLRNGESFEVAYAGR
jgi:hypothetical protein